jgi:diguanylate cyclase (GGDEF)-like protein
MNGGMLLQRAGHLGAKRLAFAGGWLIGFLSGWMVFRRELMLDDLTGLPNQRSILPTLKRRIRRTIRQHSPLCVALLDLDEFKAVNTRFGYAAADSLLREVAARLLRECRLKGLDLFRYRTGDEFLLIMNGMARPSCDCFLKELAQTMDATPCRVRENHHCVSFSIGMCSFTAPLRNPAANLSKQVKALLGECERRLAEEKLARAKKRCSAFA